MTVGRIWKQSIFQSASGADEGAIENLDGHLVLGLLKNRLGLELTQEDYRFGERTVASNKIQSVNLENEGCFLVGVALRSKSQVPIVNLSGHIVQTHVTLIPESSASG